MKRVNVILAAVWTLACVGAVWLFSGPVSLPAADAGRPSPRSIEYRNERVPEIPWSIHTVKVDLARTDHELHTAVARGSTFGLTTLSEQVRTLPPGLGRPVVAINGDFWTERGSYEGDPAGLQIMRGELLSRPTERTCFWVDAEGHRHSTNVLSQFKVVWPNGLQTPFGLNERRGNDGAVLYTSAVGASTQTSRGRELILERDGQNHWLPLRAGEMYSARVREVRESGDSPVSGETLVLSLGPDLAETVPPVALGAVLRLSTSTLPSLAGVQTAIGGGPALVRNGKAMEWKPPLPRHPRSAIGWNKDSFFFVQVDGRQRGLSAGMTFPELAQHMVKLGCTEAMNLDGGASSTLWVMGQVMNSPSSGHERNMANSLILVRKGKETED